MKVGTLSELTAEQMQKFYEDYEESAESILNGVNELIRSYNQVTNRRVSLVDNVDCDVRTLTIKGGAEIKLAKTKQALPRQIVVGKVSTSGTNPTAAVQILDWVTSGNEVTITNIVGLTTDQTYTITFTLYY